MNSNPKQLSFSIIYAFYTGIMPLIMSSLATFLIYKNAVLLADASTIKLVGLWLIASLAMGFAVIPTSFVSVVSGYFWGLKTIPFLIISYALATIIGNFISKKIDNEQVLTEITKSEKAMNIFANLKAEEFKIIVLARLSPVFPFGISNVIFTYLGVSPQKLVFAGIIGMLPRTFLMVWAASKAKNITTIFDNKWQNIVSSPIFWIGVVSLILLGFVIKNAFKRIK